MTEQKIKEIVCEPIEDKSFVLELKQQVHAAELLSSLEELKLDLLEAKMAILEKDMEIISLKKQLLEECI